ncbi:hypothetical protein KI655_19155 [Vibrio sp. D404a]|uniref:hypothetical protein n=1 Tax=unclassified Vibrio TaxID=2614977 RepID=UPI0025567500|nr:MULTISPECIES: hypothetical protein [unclassified Vibrio]MDK9739418.1 hypothetical protein [Vibrio sp. D404a]MDK9799019.1 hypothetical protein [Vibrio sp. D449a]
MIIASDFDGDLEADLVVQNRMYGGSLQVIYANVLERLRECKSVEHQKLFDELSLLADFDHRPWQFFHDCIACVARYEKVQRMHEPSKPWTHDDWLVEFAPRVFDLLNSVPRLAEKLAVAILYPNPSPKGIEAEEFIEFSLITEYQLILQEMDYYKMLYRADSSELSH